MSALPNLFILGAPKCGTTALAKWLGHHLEIHEPEAKEPHHFSTEYCLTPVRAKYEHLYRGWSPDTLWAFDASVWQLFSPSAVPNILRVRPDAHFIVMVRNPLQMIPSMHRQQVFNGNELEPALEKALALNDRRASGEGLNVLNGYPPDHLAYYHSCGLGWQVERLISRVDLKRLHVILHDDLTHSPENVLTGVYEFLGLAPQLPDSFQRINAAKVRRSPRLDRVAKSLGDWKHRHGVSVKLGLLSWIRRVNRRHDSIQPLQSNVQAAIRERMTDDVKRLGICLGRDLAHWLGHSA